MWRSWLITFITENTRRSIGLCKSLLTVYSNFFVIFLVWQSDTDVVLAAYSLHTVPCAHIRERWAWLSATSCALAAAGSAVNVRCSWSTQWNLQRHDCKVLHGSRIKCILVPKGRNWWDNWPFLQVFLLLKSSLSLEQMLLLLWSVLVAAEPCTV